MAIEVSMPQLGESVTEGTVGAWLKKEGDRVERDEPLVEVITDKVNAEVPSPVEGTLVKILVQAGETVPVGQAIALIEAPGVGSGNGTGASQPLPSAESQGAARGEAGPPLAGGPVQAGPGLEEAPKRRYSPVVRRLAREHQIDLTAIQGTGLGGRVTKKDVLAYLAERDRAQAQAAAAGPVSAGPVAPPAAETFAGPFAPVGGGPVAPPAPAPAAAPVAPAAPPVQPAAAAPAAAPAAGEGAWDVIDATAMRRTIAERMVQSWQQIPHAWAMVEADVTGLVRLREAAKGEFERQEGIPLTFVPFWVKAVVQCLREEPRLNATWQEGRIYVHKEVNVGLAVGVDNGLVVPVIRNADRHSIASLAREIHRLVEKARAGRLEVEDVQGGTITLNNTGALGITLSKSIVNPPQTAICNLEAIVKRPVVVGDAIAIRSMVNLSISFDHRVLDGVPVSRFLQGLKARMEAYDVGTSLY